LFHITITEDGKPVADEDTNAIAVAFNTRIGVNTMSLLSCSTEDAFNTFLATEKLLSRILESNPDLATLYAIKDEIIESCVSIDLSAIEGRNGK
jgi:hypothetical protein